MAEASGLRLPCRACGISGGTGTEAHESGAPTRADACAGLLDHVAASAAQAESAGRVPQALLDDLSRHGWLRLVLAPRHGGLGLDLPSLIGRLRLLARRDASVAWLVMVWAQSQITMARLRIDVFERVVGRDPSSIVSATAAGDGVGQVQGDKLVVDGRWQFTSGVHHAEWVMVHARVRSGDQERKMGVLLPAASLQIEDGWSVLGLRATGSDAIRAEQLAVPASDVYELEGVLSAAATPHNVLPTRPSFALHMAAIALGVAEAALADLLEFLHRPRAQGRPGPDGSADLLVGGIRAAVDAAGARLAEVAHQAWLDAREQRPPEPLAAASMAATAVYAVRTARGAVVDAFTAGGSAALFRDNPLQRRLRDAFAIAQHANVAQPNMTAFGHALLSE